MWREGIWQSGGDRWRGLGGHSGSYRRRVGGQSGCDRGLESSHVVTGGLGGIQAVTGGGGLGGREVRLLQGWGVGVIGGWGGRAARLVIGRGQVGGDSGRWIGVMGKERLEGSQAVTVEGGLG